MAVHARFVKETIGVGDEFDSNHALPETRVGDTTCSFSRGPEYRRPKKARNYGMRGGRKEARTFMACKIVSQGTS